MRAPLVLTSSKGVWLLPRRDAEILRVLDQHSALVSRTRAVEAIGAKADVSYIEDFFNDGIQQEP